MKELFRSIGLAMVLLLGSAVVNAATIDQFVGTYAYGGATVVIMDVPCTNDDIVKNITTYGEQIADFRAATVTFTGRAAVPACVALADGRFDVHWGNAEAEIVDIPEKS